METIAPVDHRANNFDFIRFVAASCVLFSHSFALTGRGGYEPLVRLTLTEYALGGLAVRVFFVISGFLVMQSWLRRPNVLAFAAARFLRLFPGLAVALAYCLLVGGIATSLGFREYWTHADTWRFYWDNLMLETQFFLPGVFEHNVEPRAVNGSLWSLFYEFRAYAVVLALGVIGAFRWRGIGALAWLVAASMIVWWPDAWGFKSENDWPVISVYACFIGGALVALYPECSRFLGIAALLSLAMVVFTIRHRLSDIPMDALLITGTLWFAQHRIPALAAFGRFGDFSYGIFIYAFPTQQLIEWITGTRAPYAMLAMAFPATLLCAALSWHLVEKPCLGLKRFFSRSRPVAAPATLSDDR